MEFVAITMRRRASLEDRDGLEQLVDDGLALRPGVAGRRDLVRLVDEADQPVDMTQIASAAAAMRRLRPMAQQGGVQLHEGPGEPRTAIARAKDVLPVPGGPNSMTAAGARSPMRSARSTCDSGATIRRFRSTLVDEKPFMSSHSPDAGK